MRGAAATAFLPAGMCELHSGLGSDAFSFKFRSGKRPNHRGRKVVCSLSASEEPSGIHHVCQELVGVAVLLCIFSLGSGTNAAAAQ